MNVCELCFQIKVSFKFFHKKSIRSLSKFPVIADDNPEITIGGHGFNRHLFNRRLPLRLGGEISDHDHELSHRYGAFLVAILSYFGPPQISALYEILFSSKS